MFPFCLPLYQQLTSFLCREIVRIIFVHLNADCLFIFAENANVFFFATLLASFCWGEKKEKKRNYFCGRLLTIQDGNSQGLLKIKDHNITKIALSPNKMIKSK